MKTSQNRFDQFWLFSVDFENFIIPVYQICLHTIIKNLDTLYCIKINHLKCQSRNVLIQF